MDEIIKKTLGTETAAERGQKEAFISSNIHCLASPVRPFHLPESWDVKASLRSTWLI